MGKILSVATAGIKKGQLEDVNHLQFPRIDYIELQKQLNATTLDYSAYPDGFSGKVSRYFDTQFRSDIILATISWLKKGNYQTLFAWSERVGNPFAAYRRFLPSSLRFVTMYQCWSSRQEIAVTRLGLFNVMDDIIVHCSSMHRNLVNLGAPADKVHTIHYSIDQCFFTPQPIKQENGLIMSIGEARTRDYPALFQAVKDLPVSLHVPAFGHWYAREKDNSINVAIPENVSLIQHLPHLSLRELYARSQFVVLPLHTLVYSAGATVSLEAGCMARAVIAFRSEGITDYIIDGETGILVEPGNIQALKESIEYLLANPQEAKRLGQNARQRIVEELNFETYVKSIASLLRKNESD
jgi:glycosyltransferase involved in cell wall biosynthesis